MGTANSDEPAKLSMPYRRGELLLYLKELARADPRPVWSAERERGLVSGIDQVFHFFFDDNDFGRPAIGVTLLNETEVAAVQKVKAALEEILESVGDEGDDVFAEHPIWPQVSAAASQALRQLAAKD